MANRIASLPIYSLVLVTLLLVPNAHQVVCTPNIRDIARSVTRLDRLLLPPNASSPEAVAFDPNCAGPYTGVINGRVLKWSGPSTGFLDFAVTSANWSKEICESKDSSLEPACGRPLGLVFYKKTGTLYIVDAYHNLRSVDSNGGVATLLASSAEGVPFTFLDALDVDQKTGIVYFTDVSTRFQLKDVEQAILSRDMTGRLMKYDPASKQVTVLLRNLGGPAGAALSKDGSFVLVSEFVNLRILRYWLKGPKANTSEIFYDVTPGKPDNIKRNANGDFWVAVSIGNLESAIPLGILLGQNGQVLRVLNFATANLSIPISNVQEYNGKLYIGASQNLDYVGVTRTTRA